MMEVSSGGALIIPQLIVCSLSVLSCTIQIIVHLSSPTMRRYPNMLSFYRSFCDLGFSLLFLVFNLGFRTISGAMEKHRFAFASWAEFFLLSSLSWYFMESHNVFYSTFHPFLKPSSRMKYYHIFVWTLGICMALLLLIDNPGPPVCVRPGLNIAFTCPELGQTNAWNWILLFMWIVFYGLGSIIFCVLSIRKLRAHSYQETLSTRLYVIRRSLVIVLSYTIFWAICGVLWIASYILETGSTEGEYLTSGILSIILNSMGVLDTVAWMWVNRVQLLKLYRRHTQPQYSLNRGSEKERHGVSSALRIEFIGKTMSGIQNCCDEHLYFGDVSKSRASHVSIRDAKVQSFNPELYSRLRTETFNCSHDDFISSFDVDEGNHSCVEERFSEGASGSIFFFTSDARYMIKTITYAEHTALLGMSKYYFQHMEKYSSDSLIVRIYGHYSMKLYGTLQYMIVLENIFWNRENVVTHLRYDLKGSWVGRWSRKGTLLKDNDLHTPLTIPQERRQQILCQLLIDTAFLANLKIMDYSLLVGVHMCTEKYPLDRHCTGLAELASKSPPPLHRPDADSRVFYRDFCRGSRANLVEGPGIYYFGVVDILQTWNLAKRIERYFKILFQCQDRHGISSIYPNVYACRFIVAMRRHLNISYQCLESIGAVVSILKVENESVCVNVVFRDLEFTLVEDDPVAYQEIKRTFNDPRPISLRTDLSQRLLQRRSSYSSHSIRTSIV